MSALASQITGISIVCTNCLLRGRSMKSSKLRVMWRNPLALSEQMLDYGELKIGNKYSEMLIEI